uniref:Uncharacterized protein n=1 Tax=Leersia perrieri TaxID=77586 RepID=A0A0D9X203_9ORYZ
MTNDVKGTGRELAGGILLVGVDHVELPDGFTVRVSHDRASMSLIHSLCDCTSSQEIPSSFTPLFSNSPAYPAIAASSVVHTGGSESEEADVSGGRGSKRQRIM